MSDAPVTIERLDDDAIWQVRFGAGKGNVLDTALMEALTSAFHVAAAARHVKAICLEGEGAHFSFGASVQEHLPETVAGMLRRFDALAMALLDCAVPVLAVVRGRCLGGGLELATLCHRVFASRDAMLGQPEIVLGVFAPIASTVLRDRVGRPHAEDLCLSGRTVDAQEALAMGLVDELADDPSEAALAWARLHLLPKSASSLRYAVRALREGLRTRLLAELPTLERLYLDGLMTTADATEGLRAFVEKRSASWQNQ